MDIRRNQKIAKQVEQWDLYARLTPTIFLLGSLFLIVFKIIDFETVFYVGLVGFAFTAVIWWWWAIFTIKYLVTVLNRTSKNLQETSKEIIDISAEVKKLKDDT